MSDTTLEHAWSIVRIVLLDSRATSNLFAETDIDTQPSSGFNYTAGVGRSDNREGLLAQLTITTPEEDRIPYNIRVTWAVEFVVPADLDDENAMKLGTLSGVHILWPYARQHISELTSNMGFPSVLLPPVNASALMDATFQSEGQE